MNRGAQRLKYGKNGLSFGALGPERESPLADIALSLVVPCFNEEAAVPLFYQEA
jgi:hypothetical protein